jgi:hypothetical protein
VTDEMPCSQGDWAFIDEKKQGLGTWTAPGYATEGALRTLLHGSWLDARHSWAAMLCCAERSLQRFGGQVSVDFPAP